MGEPPTIDHRNDAELFAAINRGDHSAFETLYGRYRDWVAAMAMRFTGSHADALDVLQEVFLHLARKAPHLRLDGKVTTYLYPVTRSVAVSLIRRRRPLGDTISLEDLDLCHPPPEQVGAAGDLAVVLAKLPPAQREALVMRYVDGHSNDEIAAMLKIPEGTVKSRLHHALAALRDDPAARRYFGVQPD
ncbi:MAG: RNA polymerase sigma factor [Planctomycetes bacterium]|nr:RNA polymerase sigma factor [Planctomycetota bacterium]